MKEQIARALAKQLSLSYEEILTTLEIPKDPSLGDYAFPCFVLAKHLKKSPTQIAQDLSQSLKSIKNIQKYESVGPYLNIYLKDEFFVNEVLTRVLKEKEKFGQSKEGKGKKIVIDFSSPNIAKPFGIGHLRSTIIGNALANMNENQGYKVVRFNYLGDWGTQFGKLIVGYKKFGNAKELKANPIPHLLDLYVKVNEDPTLEEEARQAFKKLTQGDKGSLKIWKLFRNLSMKEFEKIYKVLGIKFDVISGESFYTKQAASVIEELKEKGLLKVSDGAWVVNLEDYSLGVCLIQKSDGTTLYATRDIALAIDRYKKYHFSEMLYEVGSEQRLHFKQIFKVLELMKFSWAKQCTHIDHGLYLDQDGKKFATRSGKTVFMDSILEETQALAKKELLERYKLSNKELEKRAQIIANAAIFYGDLKNDRSKDMLFDVKRFVSFEGDTGPYLLYTYARAKSILRKGSRKKIKITSLQASEKKLLAQIHYFPIITAQAQKNSTPHLIATYTYHLAQSFNEFYHKHQVLNSQEESLRLAIVAASAQVLKNALALLGISVIEKM